MEPGSQKQGSIYRAMVREGTYKISSPGRGPGHLLLALSSGAVDAQATPIQVRNRSGVGMFPSLAPPPSQGTASHSSLGSETQSEGPTWSRSPCKLTKLVKSGARVGREHCDEWVASHCQAGRIFCGSGKADICGVF